MSSSVHRSNRKCRLSPLPLHQPCPSSRMRSRSATRFTTDDGEWEVVARPVTFKQGHEVRARVQRPGDPGTAREKYWAAHEKITVRRKRARGVCPPRPTARPRRGAARRAEVLYLADVRSLESLRAAGDFELDPITFSKALEALRLDGGVVHEHVLAALLRDEAEALRVVEPLHCSCCHD